MRLRVIIVGMVMLVMLGFAGLSARGQVSAETCSTFIQEAIRVVGENCGLLDRNSACYGYQSVRASFVQPQPEGFFASPNARSPLNLISSIATSPMQLALNQWGISLLSVQANLPETLPGQSVVFMLLGDSEIENAVAPEQAWQPGAILTVTSAAGAPLLLQPRPDSQMMGAVPPNVPLMADAISDSGEYVRVVYRDVPGWFPVGSLVAGAALDTLAVFRADSRTPAQAFYLRTSVSGTECVEAPNALVVQGPQNTRIDFNVNGADVRIGSTVVLRAIPANDRLVARAESQFGIDRSQVSGLLELTTIDGEGIMEPDTEREQVVLPGQRIYRCLGEQDDLGLDGTVNDQPVLDECPWFNLENVPPEELMRFGAIDGVELNYEIALPFPATVSVSATPTATASQEPIVETPTNIPTDIPTNTRTPLPTSTFTLVPTNTSTPLPTSTFTLVPTNTSTPIPTSTFTLVPSNTPSPVPTSTPVPTETPEPPTPDFSLDPVPQLTLTSENPIPSRGESLLKPSARALDFTAWISRR
jgi:hypothetical protein